ncbi:MAG: ATP-binding cassette domain-containing protein [Spirochaetia bacterium]|jgi:simple sugar transport system ATP-binding protein|nr:ATP-binding cassette domain-containing protein [Spirochaetia bacterium]
MTILLKTEKISKTFPGSNVIANNEVDFALEENEIHAIAGENGSGKSTLMHIISGLIQPDSGIIFYKDQKTSFQSPHDALNKGIGMVHQLPGIVPDFSILDNIIIGKEGKCFQKIDRKKAVMEIESIKKQFDIEIDISRIPMTPKTKQLTILISLIYRKAGLIIFDEPTASLSDAESQDFYQIMKKLKDSGKTIIFITHKIETALSAADRISVLSRGKIKGTFDTDKTDIDSIADLIIGSTTNRFHGIKSETRNPVRDKKIFEAKEILLSGKNSEDKKGFNFAVREGEILSFTGIRENNLDILEDLLSGFIHVKEGKFFYLGKEIKISSTRTLRKSGIKYIPSDRMGRGTSLTGTVENNLAFTDIRSFTENGFIQKERIRDFFNSGRDSFGIKAVFGQRLWQLSGGNIQKVILFREMNKAKKLLIFCEPSWNLDFKSREMIYRTILELRNRGTSIIMISTDIEEIIDLSDRAAVMCHGRIAGFLEGDEITNYNIGRLMLGISDRTEKK